MRFASFRAAFFLFFRGLQQTKESHPCTGTKLLFEERAPIYRRRRSGMCLLVGKVCAFTHALPRRAVIANESCLAQYPSPYLCESGMRKKGHLFAFMIFLP